MQNAAKDISPVIGPERWVWIYSVREAAERLGTNTEEIEFLRDLGVILRPPWHIAQLARALRIMRLELDTSAEPTGVVVPIRRLPEPTNPRGFQEAVSLKLRALMSQFEVKSSVVAREARRSQSYVFHRLYSRRDWTSADIEAMAGLFGFASAFAFLASAQQYAHPDLACSAQG